VVFVTSSMSVCSKSNKFIGLLLNKNYTSLSHAALSHLKSKPIKNVGSKYSLDSIIRNVHTTRNLNANVSFNLTDIGEGIREVAVKEWFVKVGDKVSQFDNICEVQSDKASVTITSRYDGVITKLHYDIDATALVGQPLIDIETEHVQNEDTATNVIEETPTAHSSISEKTESQQPDSYKKTLCIPSVRRLAKENNINLANIKGTGKGGRILKEDVLKFLSSPKPQISTRTSEVAEVLADRIEPIRGFKKTMIRTMSEALKIPHFVYCDEIAVTKLSKIRKSLKKDAEEAGAKLTMLPFFIKAASNALYKFPILNASLDENCENIIYKSSHNIAVAMDTAVGLAVPVIKNVEKLSILEIAKELNRLMKSGKDGNFTTHDLTGGTFTISNIGVIGGTYATPVILPPQVAIIAIGASKVLPRFDSSSNIIAEEILNVSGSADHRIVDGAVMANFVNLMKKQIENPYLLLLHT